MQYHRPRRTGAPSIVSLGLVLALAACGGGGGGGAPAPAPSPASPGPSPAPSPSTGGVVPQDLQAQLATCPSTLAIDTPVACMTGLFAGKTETGQADCTWRYDADGSAVYVSGGRSLRVPLALTTSGSVFSKEAATNAAGFVIRWTVGVGSGQEVDVAYLDPEDPASASGLVVRPQGGGLPACVISALPEALASGAASTANTLGRSWQAPQRLNGEGSVTELGTQPGFDAGLADDGRAFVAWRQPDANGRPAVWVVDGRAGSPPAWGAPAVLDAAAPIAPGNFQPRLAVSASGHAVVSWMSDLPCDADAYESEPAGKTCRYLYAARRLAGASAWEAAQRVRASPPMTSQDHDVRINAAGDAVISFPSFYSLGPGVWSTGSTLALRSAAESGWRITRLRDFWSNAVDPQPFNQTVLAALDDTGGLFVAGQGAGALSGLTRTHTGVGTAPDLLLSDGSNDSGSHTYTLQTSGGWAAYAFKAADGPYDATRPERLTLWSPAAQAWLAPLDLGPYAVWGDTTVVGTSAADGEFLVYAGCKLTPWRAGNWGATVTLPDYCGRDQGGGVYAFNRQGDYVGIDWAGQPGQWGYYRRAGNTFAKGAPGRGSATAGDYVLGTPVSAFAPAATRLLLAADGTALLVTANAYAELPSADRPAGSSAGGARKLWAVFLR